MALNDPVLGLSGALTTLQGGVPPMSAATNFSQPRDEGGGAADLSRAARSLESVQGDFSAQTMAINQMSQSVQQQAMSTQMLMSQLGTQIGSLTQAVREAAGGMARGAVVGGGMAFRGLGAFGGAMGQVGAFAASPFLGGPAFRPPGSFGPQFGSDIGFMRAAGMASGIGLQPENIRLAHAAQIQQAAAERAGLRAGDAFTGLLGGGTNLLGALGGEAVGSGIGASTGVFGAGFLGGAIGSMGVGAVVAAGVNETMGQVSTARGFGDQFSRNAFRMGIGRGNQLQRPGFGQRQRFGQAMNRMAVQDLTFDEGDMQEIFASMSQNDLLRGVRNTQDVVARIRDTKEVIKSIGRNMGQSVSEAAGTLAELQSLGINPMSARGRAAIFGSTTVMGMTGTEAFGESSAYARQRFAGTGLMGAAEGMANRSLQAGQFGMGPDGNLTAQQIAAMGGREGTRQAMANLQSRFMESALGQATLLAGSRAGGAGFNANAVMGMGVTDVMGRAGARANADRGALMNLSLGGEDMKREFMNDPRSIGVMYQQLRGLANRIKTPGMTDRQAMQFALRQMDPSMSQAAADGVIEMMKSSPEWMADQQRQAGINASAQASNVAVDQMSLIAQAQRGVRGAFTPAAEAVGRGATDIETMTARGLTGAYNSFTGLRTTSLAGGIDVGELSRIGSGQVSGDEQAGLGSLLKTGAGNYFAVRGRNAQRRAQEALAKVKVSDEQQQAADKRLNSRVAESPGKFRRASDNIKDPSLKPSQKRAMVKELLNVASGGDYDGMSDEQKRAVQIAVAKKTGIDVSSLMAAGGAMGIGSDADVERAQELRESLAATLGIENPMDVDLAARKEVVDYLKDVASGSVTDESRKAALDAMGGNADLLDQMTSGAEGRSGLGNFMQDYGNLFTLGFGSQAATGEGWSGTYDLEGITSWAGGLGASARGMTSRLADVMTAGHASKLGGLEKSLFGRTVLFGDPAAERRKQIMSRLSGLQGIVDKTDTDAQIGAISAGVRGALGSIEGGAGRFGDITALMTSGRGTVEGLARLVGDKDMLGSEQLKQLRAGGGAGARLADVVSELRNIKGDVDTPAERAIVEKLAGEEAAKTFTGAGDIGMIAAKALEVSKNVGAVQVGAGGFNERAAMQLLGQNQATNTELIATLRKLTEAINDMPKNGG